MKLKHSDQLKEFLDDQKEYSPEFKALTLRYYQENGEDLEKTATFSGVSVRTLYRWVTHWNNSQKKA